MPNADFPSEMPDIRGERRVPEWIQALIAAAFLIPFTLWAGAQAGGCAPLVHLAGERREGRVTEVYRHGWVKLRPGRWHAPGWHAQVQFQVTADWAVTIDSGVNPAVAERLRPGDKVTLRAIPGFERYAVVERWP